MARQVAIDPTLEPVSLPRDILSELYQHARDSCPEECCGLIVGDDRERFRSLHRCRNEAGSRHRPGEPGSFPRDATRGFYMSEIDYLRVREEAAARGERVTVIYHSHVGTGAYLSELDLEHARSAFFPFPDADHLVVAVVPLDAEDRAAAPAQVKEVGLFERSGATFAGRAVRPGP